MVGAQAIIADIVPPRERGRYMGLIGSVFAVASVAGPAARRLPRHQPLVALGLLREPARRHPRGADRHHPSPSAHAAHAAPHRLPRRRAAQRRRRRADPARHLGRHRVRVGLDEIVGLGIVGVVLLAVFVWQERRAAEPILPLQLFRSRIFSVANAMGFTIGMAMFGAIIFIPLFLQIVYGVSAKSSGLRMIPLMAGLLVTAILSGRAISRIGRYRPFPIAGTAVLVVGMFLLSLLGVDTAALGRLRVHGRRRRRARPRHAGARARRPERRAAAGHRRRHLVRHVLPQHGRRVRRRALRDDLRLAALGPAGKPAAARHRAPRQRRPAQPGADRPAAAEDP